MCSSFVYVYIYLPLSRSPLWIHAYMYFEVALSPLIHLYPCLPLSVFQSLSLSLSVSLFVYIYMCVCVCMCVSILDCIGISIFCLSLFLHQAICLPISPFLTLFMYCFSFFSHHFSVCLSVSPSLLYLSLQRRKKWDVKHVSIKLIIEGFQGKEYKMVELIYLWI